MLQNFISAPMMRRQALVTSAVAASGFLISRALAQVAPPAAGASPVGGAVCVLTPRSTEGPFYFDPKLQRDDITEGRPGVPLRLRLQVVEAATCRPLPKARVDVWHADALGTYSGYDGQGGGERRSTRGQTFLRGAQVTDEAGAVIFRTIYPGWYPGRTPHIHFKVLLEADDLLTGQLYFPDALSEFLYRNVAPYTARGRARDTNNATDGVLRGEGHESFCSIKEERDHYLASLVIGVARDGASRAQPSRDAGPRRPANSLVPGVAKTD